VAPIVDLPANLSAALDKAASFHPPFCLDGGAGLPAVATRSAFSLAPVRQRPPRLRSLVVRRRPHLS